jgi:prepilin-type N-terminal cleavage/methylation domain-containing protein
MKIVSLKTRGQQGFSLVELAVVLVILGFVLAALLLPLQAQRENTFRTQTENQLEIVRKALIGFAQTNGYLPCPATAASAGQEARNAGNCTNQAGFLPAATLGVQPTDVDGFAVDGWNNPIMYAVANSDNGGAATPDFITPGDMNIVGIADLAPNLIVCPSADNCPATYLVTNAVAVIYSQGSTATLGAGGDDENENLNAVAGVDTVFVNRGISSANHPGGEFDHMVVWISPYVLYNAMIQAGQLH